MDALKTFGAVGGVILGALGLSWGTALTIGRSEVTAVRGELDGFRKGSDQVHAAQDQRFLDLASSVTQAKQAAQAAATDSAATRVVVEGRFGGTQRAGGGR